MDVRTELHLRDGSRMMLMVDESMPARLEMVRQDHSRPFSFTPSVEVFDAVGRQLPVGEQPPETVICHRQRTPDGRTFYMER